MHFMCFKCNLVSLALRLKLPYSLAWMKSSSQKWGESAEEEEIPTKSMDACDTEERETQEVAYTTDTEQPIPHSFCGGQFTFFWTRIASRSAKVHEGNCSWMRESRVYPRRRSDGSRGFSTEWERGSGVQSRHVVLGNVTYSWWTYPAYDGQAANIESSDHYPFLLFHVGMNYTTRMSHRKLKRLWISGKGGCLGHKWCFPLSFLLKVKAQ